MTSQAVTRNVPRRPANGCNLKCKKSDVSCRPLTIHALVILTLAVSAWVKPGFHYPSWRPELTGDRFPLPANTGRVDGRAFPLAELMGRQLGPSTQVVETGLKAFGSVCVCVCVCPHDKPKRIYGWEHKWQLPNLAQRWSITVPHPSMNRSKGQRSKSQRSHSRKVQKTDRDARL